MNATLSFPSLDETNAELALRLLSRPRPSISAEHEQQLWQWSNCENRRDEFCARVNEAALAQRAPQPFLLELIRQDQLADAISIHATNHGEIIVRELIPNLFALLAPAPAS